MGNGRFRARDDDLDRVLYLDPSNSRALASAARLAKLSEYQKSIDDFSSALKLTPRTFLSTWPASVYTAMGKDRERWPIGTRRFGSS